MVLELDSQIKIQFQKYILNEDMFAYRCPDGYTGQRCEVFLTSLIALSLIGMAAFVLSLAQCLFFGIRQCYRHTKREEVHQMTQR